MADPADTSNSSSTSISRSLNDLPPQILVQIISYLPSTLEAIRTSLLSRQWRYLWLMVPSLHFTFHKFFTPDYPDLEFVQSFIDFVDQALILRPRNTPLRSFKLQIDFHDLKFTAQVNSWIRFAVSNNAEILDCDLFDYLGNAEELNPIRFEFPIYMLRSSNVKVLKLRGCYFSLPSENIQMFWIRSLSLESVVITDQMLEDLMAILSNLENLLLSATQGGKHMKIQSLKLKELTLKLLYIDGGSIEIVTPNLYTLNMYSFHVENYAFNDVSSLVEANISMGFSHCWVKVMRSLRHVQHLVSLNYFDEFNPESFEFQNLKYAELETCYTKSNLTGIMQLLALSPNLQTLVLDTSRVLFSEVYEDGDSEDFINQLSFNMLNLKHVTLKAFMGTDSEKYFVRHLLKCSVILEKIVINPGQDEEGASKTPIILNPRINGVRYFEEFVRLNYPKRKIVKLF